MEDGEDVRGVHELQRLGGVGHRHHMARLPVEIHHDALIEVVEALDDAVAPRLVDAGRARHERVEQLQALERGHRPLGARHDALDLRHREAVLGRGGQHVAALVAIGRGVAQPLRAELEEADEGIDVVLVDKILLEDHVALVAALERLPVVQGRQGAEKLADIREARAGVAPVQAEELLFDRFDGRGGGGIRGRHGGVSFSLLASRGRFCGGSDTLPDLPRRGMSAAKFQ